METLVLSQDASIGLKQERRILIGAIDNPIVPFCKGVTYERNYLQGYF